jgi:toxin ParE1/3/4
MKPLVIISEPALCDLLSINDYYLLTVNDKTAAAIIDRLEAAVNSLADFPERGSIPKELLVLGIGQYRQIIAKPYRIIFELLPEKVVVHAVLDGRRDMQALLTQRLVKLNDFNYR